MEDTAENKLTRAKSRLIKDRHPFFAVIACSMEFVEAEWCSTMATDNIRIYWGREFVEKLDIDELCGVICHEVLHVAWLHAFRMKERDPQIWNIACDAAINHVVLDAGLKLPSFGVHGPAWAKYKDMPSEEIYADLLKNAVKVEFSFDSPDDGDGEGNGGEGGDEGEEQKDGKGKGGDEGEEQKDGKGKGGDKKMWGGIIQPKDENGNRLSDADTREMIEETKIKVKEAAQAAKSRGRLPAGLEGLIEAIGKPKVNWKDYIQNWVSGHTPDDYSWNRPNRKMMVNHGIYMPRIKLNGAGVGVLSIDTSGSVSDDELRSYVREIAGVIELCSPEKLIIIQHDAIIQSISEWESGEDFSSLKVKGRGGTCIAPVFKHVSEMDEPIDWMVCFTDCGICDYPPAHEEPDFPVLWCATGPDNTPFGTYLSLQDAIRG